MVAQLLGFGVQPNPAGLNGLTMIGRSSGRVSAKSLAETSQIGQYVGRAKVLVIPERDEKSVGNERTFDTDLADPADMRAELSALADKVAARLRDKGLQAACISIKLRRQDFRTFTRQVTLATPTAESRVIAAQALALLDAWLATARAPRLRLLGVSTSGFTTEAQPDLFEDPVREKDGRLDAALDAIRGRYGAAAVSRASGLGRTRR